MGFGESGGSFGPLWGGIGKLLDWRQQKMQMALEKDRAEAALASTRSEQEFRSLEDPREQAQLRQSMYGRGMGKSSIATQEGARLTDMQARRNAALASQRGLQESGLSLIRKQRKYARRLLPLQIAAPFGEALKGAGQMAAGGGVPGA